MYEKETVENILGRMLLNLPSDVDKREGSIAFDATKPTAIELMLMYAGLDYFYKNTFGNTADREFLIERAMERGLKPYPATYARVKARAKPDGVAVPLGTSFSYDELNYSVVAVAEDSCFYLDCDTLGSIGNKPEGKLIPNSYVKGLETMTLVEVVVPGDDEEETEHFRERYLASFNSQAYGGNIADYREKVNAISGVGGVKVYPAWQGGGTVRLVFMTSEHDVPTSEFVEKVQTSIDPVTNQGEGIGIAPIGHRVLVQGVSKSSVSIVINITSNSSYNALTDKEKIYAVIDKYFSELNAKWEKTQVAAQGEYRNDGITIYISQVESRLLNLEFIEDISHTLLEGKEENLVLHPDKLATRGEVTIVEI